MRCTPINQDEKYFYYMFGSKKTGAVKVIIIPINPLLQAKQRCIRKITYNSKLWDYWVTLTFADKKNHNYNVEGWEFTTTTNLQECIDYGLTDFMRDFYHRIRNYTNTVAPRWFPTNLKKYYLHDNPSYWWIYEQGVKNNRPHFHCGLGQLPYDSTKIRRKLQNWWGAGNVQIERISQNKTKVANYLYKYVKKEHSKHEKFTGKRFWNTSRDVLPVPKNIDAQYLGYGYNQDFTLYVKYKMVKHYLKEGNFDFYIDFKEAYNKVRMAKQSHQKKIIEFLENYDNIQKILPIEAYLEYIDGFGNVHPPAFDFKKSVNTQFR